MDACNILLVKHLQQETSANVLNDLFSKYGEVMKVKVVASGHQRSLFGIIVMEEVGKALIAMSALNGYRLVDRAIVVSFCPLKLVERLGLGGVMVQEQKKETSAPVVEEPKKNLFQEMLTGSSLDNSKDKENGTSIDVKEKERLSSAGDRHKIDATRSLKHRPDEVQRAGDARRLSQGGEIPVSGDTKTKGASKEELKRNDKKSDDLQQQERLSTPSRPSEAADVSGDAGGAPKLPTASKPKEADQSKQGSAKESNSLTSHREQTERQNLFLQQQQRLKERHHQLEKEHQERQQQLQQQQKDQQLQQQKEQQQKEPLLQPHKEQQMEQQQKEQPAQQQEPDLPQPQKEKQTPHPKEQQQSKGPQIQLQEKEHPKSTTNSDPAEKQAVTQPVPQPVPPPSLPSSKDHKETEQQPKQPQPQQQPLPRIHPRPLHRPPPPPLKENESTTAAEEATKTPELAQRSVVNKTEPGPPPVTSEPAAVSEPDAESSQATAPSDKQQPPKHEPDTDAKEEKVRKLDIDPFPVPISCISLPSAPRLVTSTPKPREPAPKASSLSVDLSGVTQPPTFDSSSAAGGGEMRRKKKKKQPRSPTETDSKRLPSEPDALAVSVSDERISSAVSAPAPPAPAPAPAADRKRRGSGDSADGVAGAKKHKKRKKRHSGDTSSQSATFAPGVSIVGPPPGGASVETRPGKRTLSSSAAAPVGVTEAKRPRSSGARDTAVQTDDDPQYVHLRDQLANLRKFYTQIQFYAEEGLNAVTVMLDAVNMSLHQT